MTTIHCIRTESGLWVPADHESEDVTRRFHSGEGARFIVRRVRDIVRHRRFFKMLQLGFETWEPPALEYAGLPVVKNPETFRKDLIKAAGFYDVVCDLDGNARLEAQSMSFGNMDEDRFRQVYEAVREVLLQRVLPSTYSARDVDRVTNELMRF